MPRTWYVTFEVQKSGALPKRRSPRATKTFENETDAKNFARAKFNEGLIVFAGTINPCSPRQVIPSSSIPFWLESPQEQETADPDEAQPAEKEQAELRLFNASVQPASRSVRKHLK